MSGNCQSLQSEDVQTELNVQNWMRKPETKSTIGELSKNPNLLGHRRRLATYTIERNETRFRKEIELLSLSVGTSFARMLGWFRRWSDESYSPGCFSESPPSRAATFSSQFQSQLKVAFTLEKVVSVWMPLKGSKVAPKRTLFLESDLTSSKER